MLTNVLTNWHSPNDQSCDIELGGSDMSCLSGVARKIRKWTGQTGHTGHTRKTSRYIARMHTIM